MPIQVEVTESTLIAFCREFVARPYQCYTEHGLHARFITQLTRVFEVQELPLEAIFEGRDVGLIQKEYPTNHHFERSRRQNWDVSVIANPPESYAERHLYDHLRLAAAVEFGLNYGAKHLLSDLMRLSHRSSNVAKGFIAHLYRLSTAGNQISKRDISPNSEGILSLDQVQAISSAYPAVTVFYGMADMTNPSACGLWRMTETGPVRL
jgi:hypothetical protein